MARRAERRFRAMGTDCHVVVLGDAMAAVDFAEQQVRLLEAQWSRFLPESEISRLNAAGGTPVVVSAATRSLLQLAAQFRVELRGWFDPFLASELVALGYDRSLDELRALDPDQALVSIADDVAPAGEPLRRPVPLHVDADGRVALDPGVGFDPGGIGKGRAADIVAEELLNGGVAGALVSVGGDLRVVGECETDAWRVAITNPFVEEGPPVGEIGIREGGLATSSPLRRRWRSPDGRAAHHILDPRTGRPARIELASLTVTAPTAATAEALATAVMLAGPYRSRDLLRASSATGYAVGMDGTLSMVSG